MYENYYHHLRLAEERTKEGLRKAAFARHARAANAEATRQRRTFKAFLASLLNRMVGSGATGRKGMRVVSEIDQRLAQSRS